ncbi:MAG: hypothetical protein JJU26_00245 [Oceanicaulis sp.]|uniref:hypothetical protein n=1 Tax=Glycocaulis sp. TaxID=1969725 RepID=UPI0025C508EB|nr:hypothetical protein [Glycocaulis sp.]MCC5980127.1 hypothetical protein [Oceanicaulis sp.]MCH8521119.1 hypothetical protein [Glycocaulis sp.]
MTGLQATLATLAEAMNACRDPWAIYGGAGLHLYGIEDGPLADIDVLVSDRDALVLLEHADISRKQAEPSELFRSRHFLAADFGPVPLEIMAGLEICREGVWQAVDVKESATITAYGSSMQVATRRELIRIFRLMGREKDLRRARLLETRN